jgi:tetratricopeptide (TPR) repeat protein
MLVDNLGTSADNAMSFGDYTVAIPLAEEAYRISIRIGNLWNQAYSRWILGGIYFDQGKVDDAIRALTETMQLGDQSGFAIAAWVSRVILALLYGSMGQPARGIELLEPLAAQVRNVDVPLKAWGFGTLGFLYLLIGNLAQAQVFIDEARRDPNRDDLSNKAAVIVTLAEGELFMAQRSYDKVEPITQALLQQHESNKLYLFKADAMLLAGKALHAQGKIDAAREMLMQARIEAETIDVKRVLWEICAELSTLESECGNETQAQSLRTQANQVIEFVAAHSPADLRESFLNRPAVCKIREHAAN